MKYKSRIGKILCKKKWIGYDSEFDYIIYNENFFMDRVTKDIYDSLDVPILEIKWK